MIQSIGEYGHKIAIPVEVKLCLRILRARQANTYPKALRTYILRLIRLLGYVEP